jgi:hypothetical protein
MPVRLSQTGPDGGIGWSRSSHTALRAIYVGLLRALHKCVSCSFKYLCEAGQLSKHAAICDTPISMDASL